MESKDIKNEEEFSIADCRRLGSSLLPRGLCLKHTRGHAAGSDILAAISHAFSDTTISNPFTNRAAD